MVFLRLVVAYGLFVSLYYDKLKARPLTISLCLGLGIEPMRQIHIVEIASVDFHSTARMNG